MTFTTGTLTRCSGGNHYSLQVTIAGNVRTFKFDSTELQADPPADIAEARAAILTRLVSAAKEAGANTFAEVKTAIESKTFKV